MSETYARDLIKVLCLRPAHMSSLNFTLSEVMNMELSDAAHYFDFIVTRWRKESRRRAK